MNNQSKFVRISVFKGIWLLSLLISLSIILLVYFNGLSYYFLFVILAFLTLLLYDSLQKRHTVRRNYPLVGRLRYVLESYRPELRQYFFEGELDGKPFNRRQRSIVYQRSKNVKQTISFGMQDDPGRIGYEWAAHSVYPKKANIESFRVIIGNKSCLQKYDASVLNIGAMSYGALSKTAIASLNKGALLGKFAHNTGEGGISSHHLQGGDLIWQIGTGYFGCRNDEGYFDERLFAEKSALPQIKMIEIKLSQGAKPGHGGLLPAKKNTPEIAEIRHIKPYTTVHSPAAHTAFEDAESLIQFIEKIRILSAYKPVGFKICIGKREEFEEIVQAMVKTGIYPDFISIDGAEGGTGAAPLEFIDHMGMALADALSFANSTLIQFNIRQHIKLIASGKIITAFDIAKTIALGADVCYSARGMMFSLGCIQALQCDSGKCPVGIATQESSLYKGLDVSDKSVRVANYHTNTMKALAEFIGACGYTNCNEIQAKTFFKRTSLNSFSNFNELYTQKH